MRLPQEQNVSMSICDCYFDCIGSTQESVFPLVLLQAIPEDIPLDVVYEDDHLIVVNKVWQRRV